MTKGIKASKVQTDKGMKRVRGRLDNLHEANPIPFSHGDEEMPGDIPLEIEFHRLMPEKKSSWKDLEGWTVQLNCPTYGVKVFLRIGLRPDNTLKLFVQDKKGTTKLRGWNK